MSFFHIAIIKNNSELIAEYILRKHKLFKVMKALVKRAKKSGGKIAYKYKDKVMINLLKKEDIIVLGVTTIEYPMKKTFQCLEDVISLYHLNYSKLEKLTQFQKDELETKLKAQITK